MSKNKVWGIIIMVFLPLALIAQTENWAYGYNGTSNDIDRANSLVYGADGNIYAAGYSVNYHGRDFTVISLTTAGDTNWTYLYNGPGEFPPDGANSVVYGTDGNIYAAGYSVSSVAITDFTVISLTIAGDTNWIYRYSNAVANSVVYGTDGNIYAAGYIHDSGGTGRDFTVISLTTAGDTNWVYRYNGPGNNWDEAYSIVYGTDGNIYAAGYSIGSGTSRDFAVISLTAAGDTNWIYRYNGTGNSDDESYSIIYGADGNIYAAGYSRGISSGQDFTVISFTTAGDTNWIYKYNGTGNLDDRSNSIVYGTDGNIYAAGGNVGGGTWLDFTVISLTTAGDTNWVYRYNGTGNNYDYGNSITYGADGNIYAAGTSSSASRDFTVISLTTAGDTNWVYSYNGGWGDALSIAYGADGNVYAAGWNHFPGTSRDFTVISLTPDYGVQEEKAMVKKHKNGATILNGPLQLPEGKTCRVFDITGRLVVPEKIKPGIYFIEVDGKITQKVIKVK